MHFDAHLDTWDTYFGAPYTHGTPFRRASEEGLVDRSGCLHVGTRGPLYAAQDLHDDVELGFQVVGSVEMDDLGVAGVVERIRERVQERPVYLSVDIDVLDPAFAPGTGTPEAGGLSSARAARDHARLRRLNLVGRRRGGGLARLRPRRDHRHRGLAHGLRDPLRDGAPMTGDQVSGGQVSGARVGGQVPDDEVNDEALTAEVLAAADRLVAAFGGHDVAAYFGAFRPDATFTFYTHPEPLRSRAAYEELWRTWEADGFRVLSCASSDRHVQVLGDVAVFTHRVATRVVLGGAEEDLDERETIVFARAADGSWLAVHEHLSPGPG